MTSTTHTHTDRMTTFQDAPFDRYGRRLIFPDDKKATKPIPCTRATTIADALDDKSNLGKWFARRAAVAVTLRQDLYQFVAAHREDEQALKSKTEELINAGDTKQAATEGTTLHRWIELANLNELDPDDPAAPHDRITVYRDTLTNAGITIVPELIERIAVWPDVFGSGLNIAGRFDFAAQTHDGRLLIADLKTGAHLSGLSWAIQLAIYANCQTLYTPNAWGGDHEPNPGFDLTEALVIHLPQDANPPACTIYAVDIAAGYDALRTALDVRDWRKRARSLVSEPAWIFHPTLPDPDGHARVLERVERIKNHELAFRNMLEQWPADIPTPKKMTHPYTGHQAKALDAFLQGVEAAHAVPF